MSCRWKQDDYMSKKVQLQLFLTNSVLGHLVHCFFLFVCCFCSDDTLLIPSGGNSKHADIEHTETSKHRLSYSTGTEIQKRGMTTRQTAKQRKKTRAYSLWSLRFPMRQFHSPLWSGSLSRWNWMLIWIMIIIFWNIFFNYIIVLHLKPFDFNNYQGLCSNEIWMDSIIIALTDCTESGLSPGTAETHREI